MSRNPPSSLPLAAHIRASFTPPPHLIPDHVRVLLTSISPPHLLPLLQYPPLRHRNVLVEVLDPLPLLLDLPGVEVGGGLEAVHVLAGGEGGGGLGFAGLEGEGVAEDLVE